MDFFAVYTDDLNGNGIAVDMEANNKVTFDASVRTLNGAESVLVEQNTAVTKPADPTPPAGLIFGYWADSLWNASAYDFTAPVTSSGLTLYAHYYAVVTFTADGPGRISPEGTAYLESTGTHTYFVTPHRGTNTTSVTVDGIEQPISNVYSIINPTGPHTISATFGPRNTLHTVTFEAGGDPDSVDVKHTVIFNVQGTFAFEQVLTGTAVAKPATPANPAGKVFTHWSLTASGAAYNFATPIISTLVIRAVYVDDTNGTPDTDQPGRYLHTICPSPRAARFAARTCNGASRTGDTHPCHSKRTWPREYGNNVSAK